MDNVCLDIRKMKNDVRLKQCNFLFAKMVLGFAGDVFRKSVGESTLLVWWLANASDHDEISASSNEYQRIEYTPYGELWVEKTSSEASAKYLPYKFTGKERDEETGFYYFGARYLDAKYSRWLSADPALGEYMAGTSSGEGGIYNHVNLNLYHYGGNNPIRYTDPNGKIIRDASTTLMMSDATNDLGSSSEKISDVGCTLTAYTRIASAIVGEDISLDYANEYANNNGLFSDGNLLTPEAGATLINGLLKEKGITDTTVQFAGSLESGNQDDLITAISMTENFSDEYFVTGRIETTNKDGSKKYGHHVNINQGSVFADTENDTMNISINDTSGVRKKLYHDSRSNTLQRVDLFKMIKTQTAGDE